MRGTADAMTILLRGAERRRREHAFEVDYPDQLAALSAAVDEVRSEGGGTVWLHREDCGESTAIRRCPCDPYPVEVPAIN